MKERLSFTLDKESVATLELLLKNMKFRNRSHAVDVAISLLRERELSEKKGKGGKHG